METETLDNEYYRLEKERKGLVFRLLNECLIRRTQRGILRRMEDIDCRTKELGSCLTYLGRKPISVINS